MTWGLFNVITELQKTLHYSSTEIQQVLEEQLSYKHYREAFMELFLGEMTTLTYVFITFTIYNVWSSSLVSFCHLNCSCVLLAQVKGRNRWFRVIVANVKTYVIAFSSVTFSDTSELSLTAKAQQEASHQVLTNALFHI